MCRTANGHDINFMDVFKYNVEKILNDEEDKVLNYASGAQKDGRGNICPVTIILPTLAMMARNKAESMCNDTKEERINEFMSLLEKKIHEAKNILIERFNFICSQPASSAKFMYENNTMAGYIPEEGIISALKHGTLAMGQIGLAETLEILINKDHTTDEGMDLAKLIEGKFKVLCASFKEQYKLNFGVYYTPAENLCYTAFKKWKETYGDYEGVTYYIDGDGNRKDKLYFTNSIHVPVYKKMSPFQKIDIESQLTGYSSAGCITYVEVKHDVIHNIKSLEEMLDYSMEHDIPYQAFNRVSDQCIDCGYQGFIEQDCPKCGSSNIEHLARVTGYLTGDYKSAFNEGKIDETEDRVKHIEIINFVENE